MPTDIVTGPTRCLSYSIASSCTPLRSLGSFGANDPQRFLTVASLQQTMTPVPKQRCNKARIDGSVLDGKNRGHDLPPIFSRCPDSPLRPVPRQLSALSAK